ncbi:MAG: hypothetical protein NC834_06970 [Candidatus Omnitrophica bacterium]|nr:hypothetical protein [Candidatus Omnitrophota bacterium]
MAENSIAVREWMEKNYKRVFEKWFDGILVGCMRRSEIRKIYIDYYDSILYIYNEIIVRRFCL